MSKPLISIIVPIYNVEEYFVTCLESLVSQSYTNVEIILVDDGSPDGCGAICDDYAQGDSRIKVLHLKNGGVAKARQCGVESATAQYITFVDADDILPRDAITALEANMSDDVDLVVGTYSKFYKSGKIKHIAGHNETLSQDEWLKILLREPQVESGAPWGRLFRRQLFGEESFPNVRRTQDWLMNLEVATRIGKVKRIPEECYSYRAPLGLKKVYKPDLEYMKGFCAIVYQTLKRANILEQYVDYYYIMTLLFLRGAVLSKQYIDGEDKWVEEICRSLNYDMLSKEQLALVKSLRSIKAQKALRSAEKRKNLWGKIVKLTGCKC